MPCESLCEGSVDGLPAVDDRVADHDVNEHLSLQAANALGLIAARSEVLSFGRERAIVVERLDRTYRDGRVERVHQVDMCQALAVMPQLKYHRDGGPGPVGIIGLLLLGQQARLTPLYDVASSVVLDD